MGHLLAFPSPASVEAAWDRYACLMRELLDNHELALNRAHMEATAIAEQAWKDAFLAKGKV